MWVSGARCFLLAGSTEDRNNMSYDAFWFRTLKYSGRHYRNVGYTNDDEVLRTHKRRLELMAYEVDSRAHLCNMRLRIYIETIPMGFPLNRERRHCHTDAQNNCEKNIIEEIIVFLVQGTASHIHFPNTKIERSSSRAAATCATTMPQSIKCRNRASGGQMKINRYVIYWSW